MTVEDFLFRKCRRSICRVSKLFVNNHFPYKGPCLQGKQHTYHGGIICNNWVPENICCTSAHQPTKSPPNCNRHQQLTSPIYSERVSMCSSLRFFHRLAQFPTESIRILKSFLELKDWDSRFFTVLANAFRWKMLLKMLRSAAIVWPNGPHMNGESVQCSPKISLEVVKLPYSVYNVYAIQVKLFSIIQ